MNHLPACLVLKAREQAFRLTYPNLCVWCGGKGHIAMHPDIGQWTACECLEEGKCPRCGIIGKLTQMWGEEGAYLMCLACEWDQQLALGPEPEAYGMVVAMWECVCPPPEEESHETI